MVRFCLITMLYQKRNKKNKMNKLIRKKSYENDVDNSNNNEWKKNEYRELLFWVNLDIN